MDAEMLTVSDIANALRISVWQVRKLIRTGGLRTVKIGTREMRIERSEFDRWKAAGGAVMPSAARAAK